MEVFNDDMKLFWKNWHNNYSLFVKKNEIYGSCFIGRIFMYKNLNQNRFIELSSLLIVNKNNVVVCNKDSLYSFINNFYFCSNRNIYIMCNTEVIDDNIEHCNKIIENILNITNIENKTVYLHFGIFSKNIINKLKSTNIRTIDLGYFKFNCPILSKKFYYNIDNILSKINYYIFSNNTVKYESYTNNQIIDEYEPLIIKINNIISLNNKLDSNMEIFGIRFNQETLSQNYLNCLIKGKLTVKSNIPIKIFNGKKWLHIDKNNYNNNFEIYNINKWRISPSNEFLNLNLNKENVEFIIYDVRLKINEIIDNKL